MKLFWEAFIRLIYPATCGSCRNALTLREKNLCVTCTKHLETIKFIPEEAALDESFKGVDHAWAVYPYQSPVKELLHGIKFYRKPWLMNLFHQDIENLIPATQEQICYDYVVPIPLDGGKILDRGFNQSELLARFISKNAGIPVKSLLSKRWKTLPQSSLHREERKANLKGIFRIRQKEKVRGKNFLVVDDIVTTGATAEEAAQTLKAHGAKRVDIFALAYTEES